MTRHANHILVQETVTSLGYVPVGCDGPVTVTVNVLPVSGVMLPQFTVLVISRHPALYVLVIDAV